MGNTPVSSPVLLEGRAHPSLLMGFAVREKMPGISYLPSAWLSLPSLPQALKEKWKVSCPCLSLWDWDVANILRVQMERVIMSIYPVRATQAQGEGTSMCLPGVSLLSQETSKRKEETASNCTGMNIKENFVMERMVRDWHRLPSAVVESLPLEGLKKHMSVAGGDMG